MEGNRNIRIVISSFLSRVLVLFGRLTSEYNPRYLPVTVNSLLLLIDELKDIRSAIPDFDGKLKQSVEERARYSMVFIVPKPWQHEPDFDGLYKSITELAAPLIEAYCTAEKNYLCAVDTDELSRIFVISRARKNCVMLEDFCGSADNLHHLRELAEWCELQLRRGQTVS